MNAARGSNYSRWCHPRGQQDQIWMVVYDDSDVGNVVFDGPNAEVEARAHWNAAQINWNCYLFASAKQASNPDTGRWNAVSGERLPDPKTGPFLITDNIDARDAYGSMSHVFLTRTLDTQNNSEWSVTAFCELSGRKIFDVTHYMPVGLPDADVVSYGAAIQNCIIDRFDAWIAQVENDDESLPSPTLSSDIRRMRQEILSLLQVGDEQ